MGRVPAASPRSAPGPRHVLAIASAIPGSCIAGLAWLAADRGVDPTDAAGLLRLVPDVELVDDGSGRISRLMVAGSDVTDSLHAAAVDRIVSAVARVPEVRGALLRLQRDIARASAATGIIMAGRDIGSVVLPDADLKLYLDVSLDERARRRAEQRGLQTGSAEARHIRDELARRDAIDSTRAASPLVVPKDARTIPTDGHTLDRSITQVVSLIRAAEAAGA